MSDKPGELQENSLGSDKFVGAYAVLQKGPFPHLDPHSPGNVLDIHKELLKANFQNATGLELEKDGAIGNLAYSYFRGLKSEEHGIPFYPNGLSMSLWDIGGKLALVTTSEYVSLVGVFRERDSKTDVLDFGLSYKACCDPNTDHSLAIFHNANQSLDKLLREWASLRKEYKTEEAAKNARKRESEKHHTLTTFRIDSYPIPSEWAWQREIKSPLLLLTNYAMRYHFIKRALLENDDLLQWIEENTKLPTFKPKEEQQ